MTPKELLELPLPGNDSGANTVRGYLAALLTELWTEGEGFSGKRPFGNSGWEYDLYDPMIAAGLLPGVSREPGYGLEREEIQAADKLILAAIKVLGEPPAEAVASGA